MMSADELNKKFEDLKSELVALKIDVNQDRNRFTLAIQNLKLNLKNVAYVANAPFFELADQVPTKNVKQKE
jgi:ribosomal protein L29